MTRETLLQLTQKYLERFPEEGEDFFEDLNKKAPNGAFSFQFQIFNTPTIQPSHLLFLLHQLQRIRIS